MDLNDIRIATTLISFVLFIALVRWAWQAKRRSAFDEAAQLPFADEAAEGTKNTSRIAEGQR
jgi:cytochrome c oxidase cbb3-type subunit 4